jgi:oxidoreductase family protein
MSKTIEKPQKPEEWECCDSGCSPCVWDRYNDDLKDWKESQKEGGK